MKIRFFNTYEPVSSFYRNVVPALVDQGIQVEIVISNAEYRKGRDLSVYLGGISNVRVIKTTNFGKHAYHGQKAKLLIMTMYALQASFYALFGTKVDKNVFLTQPPLFSALGYILKRFRNQPYFCVLMDIQPQLATSLGLVNPRSLWTRISLWVTTQTLRHATGVIVIGRCMLEKVASLGVMPNHSYFIPNWADIDTIQPVDAKKNRFRLKMEWSDHFIILYSGNIGLPQYFDDLLEVASRLREKEDIKFVVIGEGVRRNWFLQRVRSAGLNNVEVLPFQHHTFSMSEIQSSGDVHFVSLKADCSGLAVPSKSYAVLASGRPMIYQGSENSEIAYMLRENEIGFFVREGDISGLEKSILNLYNNPNLRAKMGTNARKVALERYSPSSTVKQYVNILCKI